jgi:Arc/MetJ-type ribon-helix-helix transcriptional regulator
MARTTIKMPDELDEEMEQMLSYGDSKSQWMRNAIRLRLAVDGELGAIDDEENYEERVEEILNLLDADGE